MLDLFDLTGEVAFVTGGNRGIGRGMARALAKAGAAVAIAARDQAKTADAVAEIEAAGGKALGLACDVTARASVERALQATLETFGKLSILVNNAGISRVSSPEKHTEQDWDAVVDTNLKAVMFVSQAAYPALVANGRGKVINIGSEYSIFGAMRNISYGASKGGVVQLTKGLASAWARKNIQVNAILPGIIDTEIWGEALDAEAEFTKRMVARTPAGRVGYPDDLAGVTVLLASRGSDFITGQAIVVDGGFAIADPLVF
ncbi:MAG: SDR family NAD(P)-dependent oxidoreductase [Hyphomicrobiales bacterium]